MQRLHNSPWMVLENRRIRAPIFWWKETYFVAVRVPQDWQYMTESYAVGDALRLLPNTGTQVSTTRTRCTYSPSLARVAGIAWLGWRVRRRAVPCGRGTA